MAEFYHAEWPPGGFDRDVIDKQLGVIREKQGGLVGHNFEMKLRMGDKYFAFLTSKDECEREQAEGLQQAMLYVNDLTKRVIDSSDILEIHRLVLGKKSGAGELRNDHVNGTAHWAQGVQDLARGQLSVMDFGQRHPVEEAAIAHLDFVQIFPFFEGNGRIARLLMNMLLIRGQYPPITIGEDKRGQYNSLLVWAMAGEIHPFVWFIAKCTETTLDTLSQV